MPVTRICCLLPALLPIATEGPAFAAQGDPLPSATFEFDKLPVGVRDHSEIRSIMKGKLATGESVEVHESTQFGVVNVQPGFDQGGSGLEAGRKK